MREAREALAKQLQELDPDLLVELTVGLRGPAGENAAWTDSWSDRFNDDGRFEDLWINLSGEPELLSDRTFERPGEFGSSTSP